MAFADLPLELQNIYLLNFEFFGKLFIVYGFLIFCYIYTKYLHNKIADGFMGARLIKMVFYMTSMIFLYIGAPFSILLMYPQFSMEQVLIYMFIGLNVIYVTIGIFVLVNIYFYSPMYMLKFMGINIPKGEVRKTTAKIDKFLGGRYGKA